MGRSKLANATNIPLKQQRGKVGCRGNTAPDAETAHMPATRRRASSSSSPSPSPPPVSHSASSTGSQGKDGKRKKETGNPFALRQRRSDRSGQLSAKRSKSADDAKGVSALAVGTHCFMTSGLRRVLVQICSPEEAFAHGAKAPPTKDGFARVAAVSHCGIDKHEFVPHQRLTEAVPYLESMALGDFNAMVARLSVPQRNAWSQLWDAVWDSQAYVVEAVLGHKFKSGKALFRIKWKGYPETKATWEPAAHFGKDRDKLVAYINSLPPEGVAILHEFPDVVLMYESDSDDEEQGQETSENESISAECSSAPNRHTPSKKQISRRSLTSSMAPQRTPSKSPALVRRRSRSAKARSITKRDGKVQTLLNFNVPLPKLPLPCLQQIHGANSPLIATEATVHPQIQADDANEDNENCVDQVASETSTGEDDSSPEASVAMLSLTDTPCTSEASSVCTETDDSTTSLPAQQTDNNASDRHDALLASIEAMSSFFSDAPLSSNNNSNINGERDDDDDDDDEAGVVVVDDDDDDDSNRGQQDNQEDDTRVVDGDAPATVIDVDDVRLGSGGDGSQEEEVQDRRGEMVEETIRPSTKRTVLSIRRQQSAAINYITKSLVPNAMRERDASQYFCNSDALRQLNGLISPTAALKDCDIMGMLAMLATIQVNHLDTAQALDAQKAEEARRAKPNRALCIDDIIHIQLIINQVEQLLKKTALWHHATTSGLGWLPGKYPSQDEHVLASIFQTLVASEANGGHHSPVEMHGALVALDFVNTVLAKNNAADLVGGHCQELLRKHPALAANSTDTVVALCVRAKDVGEAPSPHSALRTRALSAMATLCSMFYLYGDDKASGGVVRRLAAAYMSWKSPSQRQQLLGSVKGPLAAALCEAILISVSKIAPRQKSLLTVPLSWHKLSALHLSLKLSMRRAQCPLEDIDIARILLCLFTFLQSNNSTACAPATQEDAQPRRIFANLRRMLHDWKVKEPYTSLVLQSLRTADEA